MKDYEITQDGILIINTDVGRDERRWYDLIKELENRYGKHFFLEKGPAVFGENNTVSRLEFRVSEKIEPQKHL